MLNEIEIAVGPAGVAELRAQAERLGAARHPGVVELLAFREIDGTAELETAPAGCIALAEAGPLDVTEVAGLAAAVATTLADLHDRGVAHGGLTADAIVLTVDGFPLLRHFSVDGDIDVSADVAALGTLLQTITTSDVLGEIGGWAADPDPTRRPSARALAAAVAGRVPGARLPGSPPGPAAATPSLGALLQATSPDRRRWRWGALSAVVIGAVAAALVMSRPTGAGPPRRLATPVTTAAPRPTTSAVAAPAIALWPPATIAHDGGVFAVGGRDDVVVVGAWGCGDPTAAVLRPATGEVWAYPRWARPEEEVTALPVGRVAGATEAVAADGDGDGCTDLVVKGADGSTVLHPTVEK